jgi:general secretion pathway protein I
MRSLLPGARRPAALGFTLLEVMVAIAILGLGLTTILSSQVGLFANTTHAGQLSIATGLVRCKMSEIEIELLKDGYPLTDQTDDGQCCEDSDQSDFTCHWKIEKVELPPPPEGDLFADLEDEEGAQDMAGPLGALAAIEQSEGAVLGGEADLGSISELMSASTSGMPAGMAGMAMGGVGSMAPMVMGIVYPDLKAMLEASIRRVTVEVNWKEGSQERKLEVVQFVTNPTQGGIDPTAADGLTSAVEAVVGDTSGAATPAAGNSVTVTTPGDRK